MTKQIDSVEQWMEGIKQMKKQSDQMNVTPNEKEVQMMKSYAEAILEKIHYIEMTISLAQEKVLSQEQVQQILEVQKSGLKRNLKYLQMYLSEDC